MMTKTMLALTLLGWFVINWQGKAVAGPFVNFEDCMTIARTMGSENVQQVCQARWDQGGDDWANTFSRLVAGRLTVDVACRIPYEIEKVS
jgi:hypothetical protein